MEGPVLLFLQTMEPPGVHFPGAGQLRPPAAENPLVGTGCGQESWGWHWLGVDRVTIGHEGTRMEPRGVTLPPVSWFPQPFTVSTE